MKASISKKLKTILFLVVTVIIALTAGCAGNETGSKVINAEKFTSLQDAINALPQEGGIIVIPPGKFVISEPLILSKSDVCLRGSGTSTEIINNNTDHLPALIICSNADSVNPEALWRVQLSDLRITGNKESGHGIMARKIQEIYIEGLTVTNNGQDGILMDRCEENPRVVHCNITYNKNVGLNLVGCHDIVVNGNQFEENGDALHCFDGYNLAMSGNNIDDHIKNGVVIENTYGSVVSGNMIEESNGMAIIIDRDCYGITIGSNVIAHNGGGVRLEDAHGISISANTFTINRMHSIYFSPQSDRITVTGNNFSNSYIGEGKLKLSGEQKVGGVIINGSRNILFSGNVFSGINSDRAVKIEQQPSSILFANNMLIDNVSDHNELPKSLVIGNLVAKE